MYFSGQTFNEKHSLNKNLSLFNCNVRSIACNFDDINLYLNNLQHSFSIIGVTETWLEKYNVDAFTLNLYNHEYDIRSKKIGGGVSLFISAMLNYINFCTDNNSVAIELDKDL